MSDKKPEKPKMEEKPMDSKEKAKAYLKKFHGGK